MAITKSKEYIECYNYIISFCLMMKLSGFHLVREDRYSVENSLEMISTHVDLQYQEEFSISSYHEGINSLGVTYKTKIDGVSRETVKALCDIMFYINNESNKFKIRFKLFNDILINIKNNHDIEFENENNIYIETLDDTKRLIKKIVSSFEKIS